MIPARGLESNLTHCFGFSGRQNLFLVTHRLLLGTLHARYLQKDLLAQMLFDGMLGYEETFTLGGGRPTFLSYALDAEAIADAISALPSSPAPEVKRRSDQSLSK